MSITIRLDYATCNFAPGTMNPTKVSRMLSDGGIRWRQGLNPNSPMISEMGLRWMDNNGYSELPHKLEVSGVGCSHFMTVLPDLVRDVDHRFSRLDFAFDVLVDRNAWRSFIVNAFESSLNSDRSYKRYSLAGKGESMTIYIGSRRCAKYFRIYNKTLEDCKYKYCSDGVEVEVPEDKYVIRYEVELKREVKTREGQKVVFDPSPAFDWYYGDDDQQKRLCEEIRKMWLSFGDEVLLPDGFCDASLDLLSKNKNFASNSYEDRLDEVSEKLHDYPHSFDHTLNYIVERFGSYIPYVLSDPEYVKYCHEACKLRFGFVPEYYLESKPAGFYDLDEEDTSDVSWEIPWSGDQLCIENYEEGGSEWS